MTIEVTFSISADGIVSVAARDPETGLEQSITVTASSGLTPEELKRIIEEERDNLLEQRQAASEVSAQAFATARRSLRSWISCYPQCGGSSRRGEFGPDALAKAERRLGPCARNSWDGKRDLGAHHRHRRPSGGSFLGLFRGVFYKKWVHQRK